VFDRLLERNNLNSHSEQSLGARTLSSLVREQYVVGKAMSTGSQRLARIEQLVFERTTLFLYSQERRNRREVQHDAEWLKKHLKFAETDKIEWASIKSFPFQKFLIVLTLACDAATDAHLPSRNPAERAASVRCGRLYGTESAGALHRCKHGGRLLRSRHQSMWPTP
jgi:hypothetical protein